MAKVDMHVSFSNVGLLLLQSVDCIVHIGTDLFHKFNVNRMLKQNMIF